MLIIYLNNGNVRMFVKAIEVISLTEIRAIDASTGEYIDTFGRYAHCGIDDIFCVTSGLNYKANLI